MVDKKIFRKKRPKLPRGGVPSEEPGVTYLTDYDKARAKGLKGASKEFGFAKLFGRMPTDAQMEGRVRAYAHQPTLAYADPENVAKERRKKRLRSRGRGRNTILGNGTETLG